uniref:DEK proto-oncogene n=1 Tax=Pavo cristatus TaxID=9049 RepID=A0A8C9ETW9_PAVCR
VELGVADIMKKPLCFAEKSLIVEGKREKKKVDRLTMQVSSLQKEPFTITPGKGQKLCEIERIQFFLSKKKTDELRNLHKLLYNRPGTHTIGLVFCFDAADLCTSHYLKEFIFFFAILFCIPLRITCVPVFQPLPKSKKTPSKGGKKERSSTGTTRKTKRTKCPEILSDESSSEEDEKKEKDDSSEEKESEEEQLVSWCQRKLFMWAT